MFELFSCLGKIEDPQKETIFIDDSKMSINSEIDKENPGYIKRDEAHKQFDNEFKKIFEAEKIC